MGMVLTDAYYKQVAANSISAGPIAAGVLNGAKLELYKDGPPPDRLSLLADYTICDFAGYSNFGPVVWGPIYRRADNGWATTAPSHQWALTDAAIPGLIGGLLVTDSTGLILLAAMAFASPVSLLDVGSAIIVTPTIVVGGTDEGGACVTGSGAAAA